MLRTAGETVPQTVELLTRDSNYTDHLFIYGELYNT